MSLRVRFEAQENRVDPFCIVISMADEVWRCSPINLSSSVISLARALIHVMNNSLSAKVFLLDAPDVFEFQFLSLDKDVQFQIVKFDTRPRTKGKVIFEVSAERLELVLAFWRGLRDLQGRYSEQEYLEIQSIHQRKPFPTDDVEKMTQMIKKVKKEKDS